MEFAGLTTEMIVVLGLLGLTVILFATEVFRIDVSAIFILVLVGVLAQLPGLEQLADTSQLFDGLSSNAVVSIIAVMIIGAGLDKTGVMSRVASLILKYGGATEKRIIPIISGTVGVISSFMQNVGAAALFLPVVSRISIRSGLPLGRLLMPMGFCAILGGTMTMVGSSPLILLNDLTASANATLPDDAQIAPFGLFSVFPIGVCLVCVGIVYFVLFGRYVLPAAAAEDDAASAQSVKDYFHRIYGVRPDIVEVVVPENSPMVGKTYLDVMKEHHVYVMGSFHKGERIFVPLLENEIAAGCQLAVLGEKAAIQEFGEAYGLRILDQLDMFAEEFDVSKSGVAEIVVPPESRLIGKTARQLQLRKNYGLALLAILRSEVRHGPGVMTADGETEIFDVPLQSGDMFATFTRWENLEDLTHNRDFVVVTSDFPRDDVRPHKVGFAALFFAIALGLVLFSDIRLSLCLFVGAIGMVMTGVLSINEAYRAVGWNTVFLLACLIPLGVAVQNTGTATWIAEGVTGMLDGWPIWSLQAAIAILATVFTLVMSNVGATVLLVPLAVSIAVAAGGNPAVFALTVAISTSNSFLLPTHQVNALIMGPAGYRVMDFVKAGAPMTLLFLVTSLLALNFMF